MTVVLSVVAAALLFPILIFIGGATRLAAARSECSPAAADSSASSAAKRWVIGVDSEQYDTVVENPGKADAFAWRRRILTSVVMRTAVGVHDIVTQFAQGEALPGVEVFDAANHGTDITDTGGFIGDLRPTIETWRQRIARHEITVPCVPANRTAQADSRHLASDYCTK